MIDKLKQVTLVVITQNNRILLGMKKRGFGAGKFNGFGGKPEENESLLDCAIRETQEESGLKISNTKKVAIIDFHFPHKPNWNQQVHVYKTDTFSGEIIETEEMKSQWFSFDVIPYEKMWDDDKYWLPYVLDNNLLKATFSFDENGIVLEKEITSVSSLE